MTRKRATRASRRLLLADQAAAVVENDSEWIDEDDSSSSSSPDSSSSSPSSSTEGHSSSEECDQGSGEVSEDVDPNIMETDEREKTEIRKLSSSNLLHLHFLLKNGLSRRAIRSYCSLNVREGTGQIQSIFDSASVSRRSVCGNCAADAVEKSACSNCGCTSIGILSMIELSSRIRTEVEEYQFINVRDDLSRGISTETPLDASIFRRKFLELCKLHPNTRIVPLQFNTDGVELASKRSSSCWTFSLAFLHMKHTLRIRNSASFIAAVWVGRAKPSTSVCDRVFSWMDGEFSMLRVSQIHPVIIDACCDDPAKRMVFGMRGLSSKGSCFECISEDTIVKSSMGRGRHLCTNDEVRYLMERGEGGYKCPSVASIMLRPEETSLEWLHLGNEGVVKIILKAALPFLFSKGKERAGWNSGISSLDFERIVKRVQRPSSVPKFLSNLSKSFGRDKEMIFCLVVPCLIYDKSYCDPAVAALMLSVVFVVHAMKCTRFNEYRVLIPEIIEFTGKYILDIDSSLFRSSKIHSFFFHLSNQLDLFGPLSLIDASVYESQFQEFTVRVPDHVTCSLGPTLLARFGLWQEVNSEIGRRSQKEQLVSEYSLRENVGRIVREWTGEKTKDRLMHKGAIITTSTTEVGCSSDSTISYRSGHSGHVNFAKVIKIESVNSEITLIAHPFLAHNDVFGELSSALSKITTPDLSNINSIIRKI
ncbi:hypothetical protein PFISCL1PPCAC_5533, partial [Pristionchus fissidentatus]